MRCHDILHSRVDREPAEVTRTRVSECADAGLAAMFDEALGKRTFVDKQIGILRQACDSLARLRVAAEDHDLSFRLDAESEARRGRTRNVLDIFRRDADVLVLQHNTRAVFDDIWPYGLHVGLARRIGRARANVRIERAAFEQMAGEFLGSFRAMERERAGPPEYPTRDHEERK